MVASTLSNAEFISILQFEIFILKTKKILQKVAKGGREMKQKNIAMRTYTPWLIGLTYQISKESL